MIAVPLVETLPVGPDTAQWAVWGTTARLVTTEPAALADARRLVESHLAAVAAACSRFQPSELQRLLDSGTGRPARVSPLLAELVAVALRAADRTDGAVDPTVGAALLRLGYDRDLAELTVTRVGPATVRVVAPAPGWRGVRLDGRDLTVPRGVRLDLGATAKAHTADRCATAVASRLGTGVLVGLGGDIATAGPSPDGGWRVLVQDRPGDPACTVTLPPETGLATSSTVSRRWRAGGRLLHHILDPATGLPAPAVWRTATVAAPRSVDANAMSTAALVLGADAPGWLARRRVAARLVTADGTVTTLGGWPPPLPHDGRSPR